MVLRCFWCDQSHLYQHYHDTEWGFPVVHEYRLFEKICLEGFQSGLSWLTILKKREHFRAAFSDFNFHKIALFNETDIERLLKNAGIVRHRGKIEACINNAARAIELQQEFGHIGRYFWGFEVDIRERPKEYTAAYLKTLATSPESIKLSKDLKKRGWKFVGPTTMYAFMQAMGLVNDHEHACHVREAVSHARANFVFPF